MQATATGVTPARLAQRLAVLWRSMASGGGEGAMFTLIDELGLKLTQMKSLFLLHGCADALSIGELSERMGISLPAASRTAEALLRRGWIERREDEHDRRMKRLTITPAGREVAQRIADARMQGLEAFARSLSAEQRARLDAALAELSPTTSPKG